MDKPIVIKTDILIDGYSGKVLRNAGVVIEGDKIKKTAPWGMGGPWPDGDKVLRMDAKALIPGLINAHVHIASENDLADYLRHGVTSIRDVGTDPYTGSGMSLFNTRNQIEKGKITGPRIFSYGYIIDGPKSIFPGLGVSVKTAVEAIAEVDRQAELGVDGIKLYYKLSPRIAEAIIERAAEHGLPTAGHIGLLIGGVQGARMGINTIEHLVSFMRDLFPSFIHPIVTLMIKGGFLDNPSKWLDKLFNIWRKIDPENKNIKRIAADFRETGAVFNPTIVALERMTRIGVLVKQKDARFEMMMKNEIMKDIYGKTIPVKWNDKMTRLGRECLEGMLRFVNLMNRTGVPLGVGTDDSIPFVYPGESLHDELVFFQQAGIPPLKIIQSATALNASILKRDDLGAISDGKTADLVLLNSDPSENISAVKDIKCIIKGGKVVFSA